MLQVANSGVDSPKCGTFTPCHSIRQAVANAQPADEITVAPGRYGDINGNGVLGETSEEGHAGDNPCGCLVLIDKPLAIRSRNGAKVTLIEGRPKQVAFRIVSDNVSLGVPVEPAKADF